ncbi:MAG: DUF2062 domain-containing protein [Gammaproteobacteria bacterium]|nr:DUF2062 domain-containing protein [Gammaproteobacteria bacterium]
MKRFFRRLLPAPDKILRLRFVRAMGPVLNHPRLWTVSRRGIALGVAIGVFFGLLIPLAQMPLTAAVAVAMRANVPAAITSTLVTNPVTFGPLYYAAYHIGHAVVGDEPAERPVTTQSMELPETESTSWVKFWWQRVTALGKPLLVGLLILATVMGLASYGLINLIWQLSTWAAYRRRRRLRAMARRAHGTQP